MRNGLDNFLIPHIEKVQFPIPVVSPSWLS